MTTREAFTIDEYVRLLDAMAAGGYRFRTFSEDDGSEDTLLLRHDIDKSLANAQTIARMEAERGIRATYFFLLRTPLYGLLEPEGAAVVRDIAAMGHEIGLHCDLHRAAPDGWSDVDAVVVRELGVLSTVLDLPLEPVVSFHNPPREVIGRATTAYVSAYDPRFMMPHTKYISDSNAHWREGDPTASLAAHAWPRVQVLVHPFWWTRPQRVACTQRLEEVIDERRDELDRYLRYSNDLWRDYRGGADGD